MQLIYDDVLKKSSDLKMFLRIVDVAKGYCSGKDGIVMNEFVLQTKASFLVDKSQQTTRWVRSLLRVIEAFLRNLPTISNFIGSLIENARTNEDITEQKSLQNSLDYISNPYYIAYGIGLAQTLSFYSETSLQGQKLWSFPGTVFFLSVEKLKKQVRKL